VATLEDILISPDGLLLKTQQAISGAQIKRMGRDVTVVLNGVIASPALMRESYRLTTSYHRIQRISVRQLSTQPPIAQVTLRLGRRSPADWQVSVNPAGGALLLPNGGTQPASERPSQTFSLLLGRATATAAPRGTLRSFSSSRTQANMLQLATIQNVALGGNQLLVQADRPIYYTTGWEGPRYRLTLRGARWGEGMRGPQTGVGSALSDVELRQDGQNAVLLATLTPGVRIGTVLRADAQTVVLNLNRGDTTTTSPIYVPPASSPSGLPPSVSSPSAYPTPNLSRPSGRRVVVIDPGHGGPDVGAVGIGGLRETNVVLPISLEVARLLQQQGLQVYLTRTDESREVDLPPRVALAEQVRADVFVSIHANAINLTRTDINGTEVYYAPGSDSGAQLSRYILDSIVRNVNMPNRGVRAARFYVIRRTSMPATLVETGFVTGAQDAPKLGDPQFQRQMAAAIAQGIIGFLNSR
jgi:N-acetylmuramoyl-L-alanine amidase